MDAVLTVEDLHTHFISKRAVVKVVNGVDFALERHTVLALVGESGAGKTMTARSIMGLLPPMGRVVKGRVLFEGADLLELGEQELRRLRGKEISMIFQDPRAALDPVLPIHTQVEEAILAHRDISKKEARSIALELLSEMDMPDPQRILESFPFQLSGGMCQRVALTIAVALKPKVVIADEPTSDLDVTIQAQVLARLKHWMDESHTSILFITHDLGIVAHLADQVVVLYAGCVAERTGVRTLFERPLHPYTWGLLQAFTALNEAGRRIPLLREDPATLYGLLEHCPFLPRCPKAVNECRRQTRPSLVETEPQHWVACYNTMRYD